MSNLKLEFKYYLQVFDYSRVKLVSLFPIYPHMCPPHSQPCPLFSFSYYISALLSPMFHLLCSLVPVLSPIFSHLDVLCNLFSLHYLCPIHCPILFPFISPLSSPAHRTIIFPSIYISIFSVFLYLDMYFPVQYSIFSPFLCHPYTLLFTVLYTSLFTVLYSPLFSVSPCTTL